jgi:hypothetical protein
MAKSGNEPENETTKSLGQRFMDHARGPKGFASIINEVKYALTDIRHKVVEEATYGRAVTPHWRDAAATPQPGGGIHGKADTPAQEAGNVHGKAEAPTPDAGGGVHGKASEPKPEGPAGPETGKEAAGHPAEPKGLGMSYAELTASWEKAAARGQDVGREREQPRQQEHAVER